MPEILRCRGQAGRPGLDAARYADDGRFGVPPGRSAAPAGAAWQAGFRFPAAEEPHETASTRRHLSLPHIRLSLALAARRFS